MTQTNSAKISSVNWKKIKPENMNGQDLKPKTACQNKKAVRVIGHYGSIHYRRPKISTYLSLMSRYENLEKVGQYSLEDSTGLEM